MTLLPEVDPPAQISETSKIHFGSSLTQQDVDADSYISGVGITVNMIKVGILDGLPLYALGKDIPKWLIRDAIDAAESKVEADTDLLIWERDVYCVSDLDDSALDVDDDRVLLSALDKPKNWFAGQRFGALQLPKGPAKKVLRVTLLPYGFYSKPIDIPLDRVRLDRNMLRLVPGKNGLLFGAAGTSLLYNVNDGQVIPNGVEVVYRAGFSERQLRAEGAKFRQLVMLQAAIQVIGMVQGRMAGGLQKEKVGTDGLENIVETGKRDLLGAFGGELKALKSNYADLLRSVMAENPMTWVLLG